MLAVWLTMHWETALVQLLESLGVDITGIQRHAIAPTRQVYVLRSESGDRFFAGFGDLEEIREAVPSPDEFADAYLDPSRLNVKLFQEAKFLVLGTLSLAYPQTRAAIWRALELAAKYKLKVVVDLNLRPGFWLAPSEAKPLITKLLKYVDFLKLSIEEAQEFFGTTDAGAIARYIDPVEGVLVTAGGESSVSYCLNEYEGKISPFTVKVEDTTGAGDAFFAGFIHQLCQRGIASLREKKTVSEIITYACAVGALTTMKQGAIAALPTADEVEEFMANG